MTTSHSLTSHGRFEAAVGTLVTLLMLYVPFSLGALNPTAEVAAVLAALSSYLGSTIAYSFLIPTLPDVLKLTYARTSVQVLNSLFTNYFVMG